MTTEKWQQSGITKMLQQSKIKQIIGNFIDKSSFTSSE